MIHRFCTQVLLLVLAAGVASAQAPPARLPAAPHQPSREELLKRVLERATQVFEQKPWSRYTCERVTIVDEFDSNGKPNRHEERLHRLAPVEGESFARLIRKDGKPPNAGDIEKEAEREREHIERIREKRSGKQRPDENDFNLTEEITSRYEYQVAGHELVNDSRAWVISLKPKAGPLPEKRRMDRILNRLAGKIWVDDRDYEIVQADVYLTEPVSFYAFLGNLKAMKMFYQAQQISPGVWFPARFNIELQARRLFTSVNTRRQMTYSNFSPLGGHVIRK